MQLIKELVPPFRNLFDVLQEVEENFLATPQTGIYDAIIADGGVTKNNRRWSRKDFVNAQKFFFSDQPIVEKSKDPLMVSIGETFNEDGSMRLDRIIGQVVDMKVVDIPNSWYVQIRFAILDINERTNPWFETMAPVLTRLHGFYKAVPCGKGIITPDASGIELVNGFQLRYILLTPNSGFQMANAVQPFVMGTQRVAPTPEFRRPVQPSYKNTQASDNPFARRG